MDSVPFSIDTNYVELYDIESVRTINNKYYITVYLNDKLQRMEVDSGAKFLIISKKDFDKLNLKMRLEPDNLVFRSYSGHLIPVLGKAFLKVKYRNKTISSNL